MFEDDFPFPQVGYGEHKNIWNHHLYKYCTGLGGYYATYHATDPFLGWSIPTCLERKKNPSSAYVRVLPCIWTRKKPNILFSFTLLDGTPNYTKYNHHFKHNASFWMIINLYLLHKMGWPRTSREFPTEPQKIGSIGSQVGLLKAEPMAEGESRKPLSHDGWINSYCYPPWN